MTATDLSAEIVRLSPSDVRDNDNDRLALANGTHTLGRSEDISNNNCASNTRKSTTTSVICLDIGFTLFSFCLYIGDILSDGWLAYSYYTRGHWHWFTFTLIVLLVPALISTIFSSLLYVQDYHSRKKRQQAQLQYLVIPVFLVFQPALR